jgi:hypothetical protein
MKRQDVYEYSIFGGHEGKVVDLFESDITYSTPRQLQSSFSFKRDSRMITTDGMGEVRRKQLSSCSSRQFGVSLEKPQSGLLVYRPRFNRYLPE